MPTVSTVRPPRGGSVDVSTPACDDEYQLVEARLVVGRGSARRTAAIVTGWGGTVTVTVPSWAPSGRAVVETSCQEPGASTAGDGADVRRTDFAPVAVTIPAQPSATKVRGPVVASVVHDGTLRASGDGCPGTVYLAVARGRSLVGSATRYHYGRTTVAAGPDGRWNISLPLRYAVGEFRDPVAPGPMVLFASCGPVAYPPRPFQVAPSSPPPAVTVLPWDPSGVYLAQCDPANTLRISAAVTSADGTHRLVTAEVPGHEYGEQFQWLDLPPSPVAVSYTATCAGSAGPAFAYAPASWPAP